MPADSASRQTAREHVATLLNTEMVGAGKPLQIVYDHEPETLTELPAIAVVSGGSARVQAGIGTTRYRNEFRLTLMTYVKDTDPNVGWTSDNVEDQLDNLDKELADVIADNRAVSGKWTYLGFEEGMSDVFTDIERGCKVEIRNIIVMYFEPGG